MEANDIVDRYLRSQDAFEVILAAVPTEQWNVASACEDWTVRDVVGHVIWGMEVLRHHAKGQQYTEESGPPGSDSPGELAGDDPLAGWQASREAAASALTEELLEGSAPAWFVSMRRDLTFMDFLELTTLDTLVHTWDIGSALGLDVDLDAALVKRSFTLARLGVVRSPSTFGPKITPPPNADPQTRLLTFLGRSV